MPADLLDDWNDAVLVGIRSENTSPPLAARNLAVIHLAIYNAIESTKQATLSEASANAAAYRAAIVLFPSHRALFDKLWSGEKARLDLDTNVTLGFAVADGLLQKRSSDDSQLTITYVPSADAGAWRRTLPWFRPPELPQWGSLKPFVIERRDLFRAPPPPSLASREYESDFNEVKRLGARNSTARTAYETETARFWSDFTGTVTPPGHWNQIARTIAANERVSFRDKARLLALLNVAMADAAIVCWEAKYKFNFWRPVTAIRRAAEDGNAATDADPEWEPLLVTPPFPEYLSGHSTFSGAAGEILTRFFGRDDLQFAVGSDSLPGVVRVYESISAVVDEVGRSRILGGIHFRSADTAGRALGRAVGANVFDSASTSRLASLREN